MRTDRYGAEGHQMPLCFECAERLHLAQAEKFCKEKGFDTTEKMIAYCRGMMAKLTKRMSRIERVPGEDDDRKAA